MKNTLNPKYAVGFVFNSDFSKILLIHKQKPEWQKGKVNGIGGKLEPNESPVQCMTRETREETTLQIPEASWVAVGHMEQGAGAVAIFAAVYGGSEKDAARGDHEEVEWFEVGRLPQNVMRNIPWLVPLCMSRIQSGEPSEIHVFYP